MDVEHKGHLIDILIKMKEDLQSFNYYAGGNKLKDIRSVDLCHRETFLLLNSICVECMWQHMV